MNILKTPDYRSAVATEAAGVNRYRRQTTPRNEYIRSSAGESSASSSGTRQVSLGTILTTPPTSILLERRATVRRSTQNSRSTGIDTYRRNNDYFDRETTANTLQLPQSSQITTVTASPLRPSAVIKAYQASTTSTLLSSTLSGSTGQTGILGDSGSSILSTFSPAGVMQQGIQQYQLMDSSSESPPTSLSRGADLYLKTGTKLVNESGLFA